MDGHHFVADMSAGPAALVLPVCGRSSDAAPPVATVPANLNTSGDERHPRIGSFAQYLAYQGWSPDSTGWNVHYYSREGEVVVSPAPLARTSSDVQPSVRLR